jgi:hypothetical protein
MATATLVGIFIVPVLYVVIQQLAERRVKADTGQEVVVPSAAAEVLR